MAGNISKSNDLNLGKGIFLKIISILGILFLIAPLIILVVFSFNSARTMTQWEGFSLRWYKAALQDETIWLALKNSLIIGVISTIITTILGTAAALAIGKYAFKGKKAFENMLYIPVILPEIIFGIALLALYAMIRFPLGFASIIVAHVTFTFSFVTLIVLAKVNNFDRNLEEASLDLGAGRWQTFRRVILPNIAPGIISGAVYAFTMSLDDFVVTFFTAGVGSSTLPLKIYSLIKTGVTPTINAISTILILFTIIALLSAYTIQKNKDHLKKGTKTVLSVFGGIVAVCILFIMFYSPGHKNELNICNYADYLDDGLIDDFEKEYGIKINLDYMNDTEELLTRMMMGVSGYDLIVPTGNVIKILIANDLLSPIDYFTNYDTIDSTFTHLEYDPTGKYYVPYAYGFTAIAYNSKFVKDPVNSWSIMWDQEYKGRMLMLDFSSEAFFSAYKKLGLTFDTNPQSLQQAYNALAEQKPLLKKYESNLTWEYLISEEVYLAQTWNGSITRLNSLYPQFKMILPQEGVAYFVDNLCIPKSSANKENALLFLNFLYSPKNAARNMEKIMYTMPVPAAWDYLDDFLKTSKIFCPDPQDLPPVFILPDFGDFKQDIDKAWTKLKSQ
ncbi:MAG TPA: extracellular solute-binding protein [Candidatus Cloacimonadota bacterium]|nr:extracellular solute-binding protein [Candidatus Cloacimonadota bacterium]